MCPSTARTVPGPGVPGVGGAGCLGATGQGRGAGGAECEAGQKRHSRAWAQPMQQPFSEANRGAMGSDCSRGD